MVEQNILCLNEHVLVLYKLKLIELQVFLNLIKFIEQTIFECIFCCNMNVTKNTTSTKRYKTDQLLATLNCIALFPKKE